MSFDTDLYGKTSEIYKESSTKKHTLGTRLVFPDGRVYRYAKSGAAIAIGTVCGMAAYVAKHAIDAVVKTARTTAQWDAGTNTVTVSTTAVATASIVYANRYDDGYIFGMDQAGQGQILQIKSHTAGTTAASSPEFTIYDDDLLTVALTTASQVGIIKNLYDAVVTHLGTVNGGPALGVTPIAVSAANKYFWLQTWGPCPVIRGVCASVRGDVVVAANSTAAGDTFTGVAGSAYPAHSTMTIMSMKGKHPFVGFNLVPSTADGDFDLIYLTIAA